MKNSELLLALFVGIYGSFGLVLKIIGSLNERRDVILGLRSGYTRLRLERRAHLLAADWVPLWIAGLVFLVVAMVVFIALPDIADARFNANTDKVAIWKFLGITPFHAVSYLSAILAFVGFNALAWGGNADFVLMRTQLRRVTANVVPLTYGRRVRRRRGAG